MTSVTVSEDGSTVVITTGNVTADTFNALVQRVTALETDSSATETRVAALEALDILLLEG